MKNFTSKTALLLTALFLSGMGISNAQNPDKPTKDGYLSYFGNDSTNINIGYIPCEWYDYSNVMSGVIYSRDTIRINGKRYFYRVPQPAYLVSEPENHYLFPRQDTLFLREERETGRLYRYYRNYFGTGETEKLISDMSLKVGDKFLYPHFDCLREDSITVRRISYDNGIKTIEFWEFYANITFHDGLFPTDFPLWQEPVEYGLSTDFSILLCEYKDGELVYGSPSGCYDYHYMNTKEKEIKQTSVFPNIITGNDIITIVSSSNINDVSIIDMFGRTKAFVPNKIDSNKWQIHINGFCIPGIHFIIVKTDIGLSYEKILICM